MPPAASSAAAPIVQAKFLRPRLPDFFIPRPRLIEQLNRGLSRPLTLICASAGYGKTMLASSWINELESHATVGTSVPAAWLSLDAGDCDLPIFIRNVVAALRTIVPHTCPDTYALVTGPRPAPTEELAATLNNDLSSFPRRFILVLDEFEIIQGRAVPDLLNSLRRHWPRPLHLVLISRYNPPLPLPDLRAKGLLTELRTRDLRFTPEEAAAFVSQAVQAPLSESVLQRLQDLNEGWIAGLQVASMALRRAGDAEAALVSLSGAHHDLSDFLADEVLAHQPRSLQLFMLKTSILDSLCAGLCDAVAAGDSPHQTAQDRLASFERADLFVTVLDERRQWYRYHALFRDMLQTRLSRALDETEIAGLHRRAALWLAQHDLIEDALRHALDAHDLNLAAAIIEDAWTSVLNREDRPTLARWLALLPDDLVQSRPKLLIIQAWKLMLSWQLPAQAAVAQRVRTMIDGAAGATLSAAEQAQIRGQLAALRTQVEFFSGHMEVALACAQEALELLPARWLFARASAALYLGVAMQATAGGEAAERHMAGMYESLSNKTDIFALRLLMSQCFVALFSGRLQQAVQTAQVLREQLAHNPLPLLVDWSYYFLAVASYEQNDLQTAERYVRQIAEDRYIAQETALRDAMCGLALIRQATGRSAAAAQALDDLVAFDVQLQGQPDPRTRSLQAHLMLLQGNTADALRWAESFTEPPPDRPLVWLEEPQVTRAHILAVQGGPAAVQALAILEALARTAARTHNVRVMITIQALRAVALDAMSSHHDAESALRDAVDLATPGRFVRVFLDIGPRLQAVLQRLARSGAAGSAVHTLSAAFAAAASPGATGAWAGRPAAASRLIEPITRRELDVLMLLCEPLSNREIAAKLNISYFTEKNHLAGIYAKLGVTGRWDAVAKATELGILPAR